jgi:methyl-accepting chemotaxis protein
MRPAKRWVPISSDSAGGKTGMPVWLRLVVALCAMLLLALSSIIAFTYVERRDASIAQARDFSASLNQMTLASLTALMIVGASNQQSVFLEQVRTSNDVTELEVYRTASVVGQYGEGPKRVRPPSPQEESVMKSGKPYFEEDRKNASLYAVYPILNRRSYLGKDCMTCHAGAENHVLGAVAMRISLSKAQADLKAFTLWVSLIAAALSVPVLASVYLLVRRFVVRPLGGEPADAMAVVKRIAAGDLATGVPVKSGDTSSIMVAMSEMRERLARITGGIHDAGDAITVSATQIARGNADLSQRTEEQASTLEQTAASMEELASTVKQNADSARHANQLAADASKVATKGGEVVGHVVSTMGGISDSSKKIVEIISVIDGIAFQTNILALNAAVEAARAGEQGRGFAVVASEVRTLAQRSAAAAKEIKVLISESVHQVEDGTKLVDEAGRATQEIVASIRRVAEIMGEIADASQQQSSGIEQVNQAVAQMDHVTQQNAALVEQAAAAAESMQEQARNLARAVAVFKLASAAPVEPAAATDSLVRGAARILVPRHLAA